MAGIIGSSHTFVEVDHFLTQFVPEMSDEAIPISNSLSKDCKEIRAGFIPSIGMPKLGSTHKVSKVHFKDDPLPDRFFAIKHPQFNDENFVNPSQTQLFYEYYLKNMRISARLGNHDKFMKVYGVALKRYQDARERIAKPCLILSYDEGSPLKEVAKT